MITDVTPEIFIDEIKLDEILNAKTPLPSSIHETIQRECGHLILADEILQKRPKAKKAVLQLLNMDHLDRVTVTPIQKNGSFLEKMLVEAKKSSSRYAVELLASLHNLIDEFFLNPYLPEKSHAITTFIRYFERFSRHHLQTKL